MPEPLSLRVKESIEGWISYFNTGDEASLRRVVHAECENYPISERQILVPGKGPAVFMGVALMLRKGFPDLKLRKDEAVALTLKDREGLLEKFTRPPFADVCPGNIGEIVDIFLKKAGTKVFLGTTLSGTNTGQFQGQITNKFTSDRQIHLLVVDKEGMITSHGGCRNDLERAQKLGLTEEGTAGI